MNNEEEKINIWGARVHNLKNIDVEIPRNKLTVYRVLVNHRWPSTPFLQKGNVAI